MTPRSYEHVPWQSESLRRNIEIVQYVTADAGCPTLAEEVPGIAREAGPLNFSLAQWSKDDDTTERNKAATVVGELMCAVAKHNGFTSVGRVIPVIEAVLRWEHGFEALSAGLEAVSHHSVAGLLSAFPGTADQILAGSWLCGLLRIAGLSDGLSPIVDDLRKAGTEGDCLSACAAVDRFARRRLTDAAAKIDLAIPVLDDWQPRMVRFWCNAVVLAMRYRCDQDHRRWWGCFQQVMAHVVRGECWPVDCTENESFQKRARDAGTGDGFWTVDHETEQPLLGGMRIEFLKQPLEVLNMANAFDTCLRLKGAAECKILGWAANVNVRIIAIRGEDKRIIGRRTIALSYDLPAVGVRHTYTYPRSNCLVHQAINQFTEGFLKSAGLKSVFRGAVQDIVCAPGYNQEWLSREQFAGQCSGNW